MLKQMKNKYKEVPPHSYTVVLDGLSKSKALTNEIALQLTSEIYSQVYLLRGYF